MSSIYQLSADPQDATAIFTLLDTHELVIVVPASCLFCEADATDLASGGAGLCEDCALRAWDEGLGNTISIGRFVDEVAADLGVTEPGDIVQADTDAIGLPA